VQASASSPDRAPLDLWPVEGRVALARSVAADLETIFGPPPAPERAPGVVEVRRLAPDGGPPRPSLVSIAAIVAAALAGIVAGAATIRTVRPTPAPTPTPIVLVAAAPPSQTAAGPPAAAPEAAAPPRAARSRLVATPPRPAATRVVAKRPRTVRAAPAAPIDICGRTCSRAEIMTADQRLRSAYARAERAGVPRPVLASYRNRWAALRRGASDEPHRLVQGYVRLAVDLNDRARDARARRS